MQSTVVFSLSRPFQNRLKLMAFSFQRADIAARCDTHQSVDFPVAADP